jgi:ABC-type multidrug transport system fused ATPase/permease subunit
MLLIILNRLSSLVLPYSNRFLIDEVIGRHQTRLLFSLAVAVVVAVLIQATSSFALTSLFATATQELMAELRQKVQRHIGSLSISYHDSNKAGLLASRIMWDAQGVRNLVGLGMLELAGAVVTAVVTSVILCRISPGLTLLAAALLTCYCCGIKRNADSIRPVFRENDRITSEVNGRLIETIAGVRVVKGFRAENFEAATFAAGMQRVLANTRLSISMISRMSFFSSLLTGALGLVVIVAGTLQVLSGRLTLGEFVTYMVLLGVLASPAALLSSVGPQLSEAFAGIERTQEVLREEPEDLNPDRTVRLNRLEGEVAFDKVQFSYEQGKQVLFDMTFTVKPGSITALVGPSGAGKSTIASLVAALYSPTGGKICVDGHDLATARLDSYRTQLGLVPQEGFLFDGTIAQNVAFARPDASKDQILAACRLARVDEFAETFERGYETIVGERGVRLSGGQRQRISIARAILVEPRILILDEATSSLDTESEILIQDALDNLMRNRTTFVIAHRLSTVLRADQILVIESGRIVERGTHGSLCSLHGMYWGLYTQQFRFDIARGGQHSVPPGSSQPDTPDSVVARRRHEMQTSAD